ncbi:MAG: hypothetical protein ABR992_01920 [Solirubrobacteraceae bacterium]|jgi:hypothetical protein
MDAQNRMDAQELQQFEHWKANHWKGEKKCPICEANSWGTNPRVGYFTNEQTYEDGSAYPVVLIYCNVCGYTISIGAIRAGIRNFGFQRTFPQKAQS